MPHVEEATCLYKGRLIDRSLPIETARKWGRPYIDQLDFLCCECGVHLIPVVGAANRPLRHSPSYRIGALSPHRSWCPYLNEDNIRRTEERVVGSQYVADEMPSVFEMPDEEAPRVRVRPNLDETAQPTFDIHRTIRLRTRNLERLASHYQALRTSGTDAPLSLRGCVGQTYFSVFQRMAEMTTEALALSRLQVFVGHVKKITTLRIGKLVTFSASGRKNARPPADSGFSAHVIVRDDLYPPQHLQSVQETLGSAGRKIMYVVGRFQPVSGKPGEFRIYLKNAQHVYVALLAD